MDAFRKFMGVNNTLFQEEITGAGMMREATQFAPSGGHSGAPTTKPTARRHSFASRVFGYDVFISYAIGAPPRRILSYASDLARRLRERDFTVFFSEDEAHRAISLIALCGSLSIVPSPLSSLQTVARCSTLAGFAQRFRNSGGVIPTNPLFPSVWVARYKTQPFLPPPRNGWGSNTRSG